MPTLRPVNSFFRPPSCIAWIGFLLVLVCFGHAPAAGAADVSLHVSIPEEMAYAVRQWRREHGLPQAPETTPTPTHTAGKGVALSDGGLATQKALRLLGLDGAEAKDLEVSARHDGAHWQVSIKVLGDSDGTVHVIEVADSLATAARPHAP